MTTTAAPPVHLDWRKHKVGDRKKACRICGHPALMRDEQGRPCHKTCAEQELADRAAAAVGTYQTQMEA